VSGIGEQSERARDDAPCDLDDHEEPGDERGKPHAPFIGVVAVCVRLARGVGV
jgi:hypothetical protein